MFTPKKKGPSPRTIGLLTDFGLSDPYVGQVKAVLARKVPACLIVDISHGVEAFNVAQAGFFLAASYPHFPTDAVIMAVVDPGVGSDRKIVGLKLDDRMLVAPDNGLLGLALQTTQASEIRAFDLSVAVTAPEKVADTFHGRDVFAPLAAWLALGGDPTGLGSEMSPKALVSHDWCQPRMVPGRASAHVLHIDRFGNCVLNLRADSLDAPNNLSIASHATGDLAHVNAYADMPEGAPGLLEGSQGFLEIAVNQGSAADRFNLSMGDAIELTWED